MTQQDPWLPGLDGTSQTQLRDLQCEQLDDGDFDTFVIGGGINGAVSVAALAARGVKAALVDRGDFAGFTSQESSNLVWGGFKYLQTYEFMLVRKLCVARNRLIKAFPSSIEPIDFLAVFDEQAPFPPWLASLGSFAYWGIGNFDTRPPRPMTTGRVKQLEPVVDTTTVRGGLRYADAYLKDNDARFVFNFIRNAITGGATAANYVAVTGVERINNVWHITLADQVSGRQFSCRAKTIVNAAGPFLDALNEDLQIRTDHRITLSKGIHLVVPRIGTGTRVLAFFDEDERLYYVIPMGNRSVIGTTDTLVDDPTTTVTDEDRDFVLRQVNSRLVDEVDITRADIIAERTGVRPLVVKADDDGAEAGDWLQLSRRHEIEVDRTRGVISIFGGKLTDCLNVGDEVADAVADCGIRVTEATDDWFGESGSAERSAFLRRATASTAVTNEHGAALWRRYDRRAHQVLDAIEVDPTMVTTDPPYAAAELAHVGATEMIVTIDDFLRRRSALALTTQADALDAQKLAIATALGIDPVGIDFPEISTPAPTAAATN